MSNPSSFTKYEIRRRIPNPNNCVLLVIDVQNHFSSMAIPILPALNATIRLCRSLRIPIVFTRHSHKSPSDHAMLGEWWNDNLVYDGTSDADFLPGLDFRKGEDRVVEKNTYSAFRGTGMEELLRGDMGVEEVIVTGVMTNLCCETSAREAFVRGFRVFFSADATGTATRDLQEATLKNMAHGFAYLLDCKRLEAAFFNAPAPINNSSSN